jgi:hypothetical protein
MMQFTPAANFVVAMTGASVSQALGTTGITSTILYLANSSTVPISIRWGVGPQTALATDFTILPGTQLVVGKGLADTVAAFGASGTLYISAGTGA